MLTGEARRVLRVGDVVERDIDGIWFPAEVLAVHDTSKQAGGQKDRDGRIALRLAYDLLYLDDHNRESEVPEEDVRAVQDATHKHALRSLHQKKEGPGQEAVGSGAAEGTAGGAMGLGGCMSRDEEEHEEQQRRQEQENGNEDEGPKVTIHSSHGTFDTKEDGSSTAYIINGPETNVAAGSGLRGIRWLRGP